MGIVGTFSGYLVYLLMRKVKSPLWFATGMAGFVGVILTYITTALELALSLNPDSVLSHWALYSMGFMPTQLPLAVAEFVFTAGIVQYIADRRPDLLAKKLWGGVFQVIDRFTKTALVLMIVITAIFLIGAYLGYIGGHGMEGTDAMVEEHATSTAANVEAVALILAITDLVGIGTTIGFFVFLILGHYVRLWRLQLEKI